jgi:hypothetical protein
MPLIPTPFSGTRISEVVTPKTALAFYASLLLIDGVVTAALTVPCASVSALNYLVPWVLGFGAFVFLGIVAVVIGLNIKDPSKLQLGEVTSRDYIQIQHEKAIRGDSIGGQYLEPKPAGDQMQVTDSQDVPALNASAEEAE